MTSDQNVSDVQMHSDQPPPIAHQGDSGQDAGQNVQHGMGQSKSSRRRRRKRKGKGPEDVALNGAAQGGDISGDAVSAPQSAAPQGQPSRQQNSQASSQQNGQSAGTNANGTKRWKKKFRDRDRPREGRSENPGNQASGSSNGHSGGHSNNGGGARNNGETHQFGNNAFKGRKSGGGGKQQSRGPRSFVGPMDHSYRVVNGNFADTPPSTIESSFGNHQSRGNGHSRGGGGGYNGDSQPIDYSQGRTIPIPEDAQTKIFFFIDDLFFVAKIQETARKLGVKIEFVKNDKESVAKLTGVEEADRPALIVFDLNNASAKPMTLIPKLKTKFKKSTSIVGFLSHLQGDLKAKAVEAGCDSVMPRAAFSQNLPNLLRRYGIVEEEEPNFNQ
jgi:hypothetical protein